MDCYSRRIVGWAIADHLRAELVTDALEMAVARRRPDAGLVHHSDRGSQYTSLIFTRRCRSAGIDVSMGSRGDCFDNAVLESFHATLKKDLIHRRSWPTKAEARTAVFDYIEAFYNRRRRHSLLGMLSPVEFENGTLSPDGAASPLRGSRPPTRWNTSQRQRPKPPNNPVSTKAGNSTLARAVNEAYVQHLTTPAELATLLTRSPGRRTTRLTPHTTATNPTRSHLEDDFLRFIKRHRLPDARDEPDDRRTRSRLRLARQTPGR